MWKNLQYLAVAHAYCVNLIIEFTIKKKMSQWCSEKEKFFKFFFSDV